ncbi:hypothetical protein D3C75_1034150 [compost metagenome]
MANNTGCNADDHDQTHQHAAHGAFQVLTDRGPDVIEAITATGTGMRHGCEGNGANRDDQEQHYVLLKRGDVFLLQR